MHLLCAGDRRLVVDAAAVACRWLGDLCVRKGVNKGVSSYGEAFGNKASVSASSRQPKSARKLRMIADQSMRPTPEENSYMTPVSCWAQTSFQMLGADGTAPPTTLQARLPGEGPVLRRIRSGAPPAEQARLLAAMGAGGAWPQPLARAAPGPRRLGARHGADGLAEGELATFGVGTAESVRSASGPPCPARCATPGPPATACRPTWWTRAPAPPSDRQRTWTKQRA